MPWLTWFCRSAWPWRLLAAALILGAAGLRIAYLASPGALDLAPDEAHYWDWSRHLDWSYYSKGPLVAYLIRGGCLIAGDWSEQLIGNQMLAVRLPAILCGSLLLLSLYVLTKQVFGRDDLAAGVVSLALTLPLIVAGSSLMTIDAPYCCLWGWALVVGHRAVMRESWWAWPLAGLLVGLGILAKYTMVLWLPSLGLFLLFSPPHRHLLRRPGFWIMTLVAFICCAPILVWNAQHEWVTFRHVGGQAGLAKESGGIRWLGPLSYLGGQFALLLGFWFVFWIAALIASRPWKESDAGRRYLWWMSVPMFGVFLAFSLKTQEQANWPVTAYLSGLVLAAGWLVEQAQAPRRWYRWTLAGSVAAACLLGIALSAFALDSRRMHPALALVSGKPRPEQPLPLRQLDPTCRLRGWRTLAGEVDRLREQLQAEGADACLAGTSWTLPGELGFYCQGQPTVYSLGLLAGDRRSQYDFWDPNPIRDPESFRGRTFIVVGAIGPNFAELFERVESPVVVTHYESGQPVAQWVITVCRGFRGAESAAFPSRDRY